LFSLGLSHKRFLSVTRLYGKEGRCKGQDYLKTNGEGKNLSSFEESDVEKGREKND
jgi:hypothetical protein